MDLIAAKLKGNKDLVKELERQAEVQQIMNRLMDDAGLSEEDAAKRAEEMVKAKEELAKKEDKGDSKIKGYSRGRRVAWKRPASVPKIVSRSPGKGGIRPSRTPLEPFARMQKRTPQTILSLRRPAEMPQLMPPKTAFNHPLPERLSRRRKLSSKAFRKSFPS